MWIESNEGAKFWAKVLFDLRNRGLKDISICYCNGLSWLREAIRSVYPDTVVQTCTVHLIRSAMRFVSYQDRKKIAASMRSIYTAPTPGGAELAMAEYKSSWGARYPAAIKVGKRVERVHPVPGLPRRAPQNPVHHQRHRIDQLSAAEDHQNAGSFPRLGFGDEAAVSGNPEHLLPAWW